MSLHFNLLHKKMSDKRDLWTFRLEDENNDLILYLSSRFVTLPYPGKDVASFVYDEMHDEPWVKKVHHIKVTITTEYPEWNQEFIIERPDMQPGYSNSGWSSTYIETILAEKLVVD